MARYPPARWRTRYPLRAKLSLRTRRPARVRARFLWGVITRVRVQLTYFILESLNLLPAPERLVGELNKVLRVYMPLARRRAPPLNLVVRHGVLSLAPWPRTAADDATGGLWLLRQRLLDPLDERRV